MLDLEERVDRAALDVFANLAGADLHMRSRHHVRTALPKVVYRYQRRGTPRRRVARSKLPVVLRHARGLELRDLTLRDLSLTGAGLQAPVADDVRVGEPVTLLLGSEERGVELRALCVRKTPAGHGAPGQVWLGLQFVDLTPKHLRMIDRLMRHICE